MSQTPVLSIVSITNVVSAYVQLQEGRKMLRGNCPFHADQNASFMVSTEKNIFKCFGCGKEGGPIEFLMAIQNKSRVQVIESLATKPI
jgi:DNA primase